MFFRSSLLFPAALAVSQALAKPLEARQPNTLQVSCLPAGVEASCYSLVSSCLLGVNSATKSQLWHNRSCVAAATCFGVGNLETSLACQLNTAVTNTEQISLDYNTIYAGIVGSCAFASGGCPITQQNYIDFYYGSLSAINSGSFPAANTVISWWFAIASWTATGNTIPYLNFNDWLHFSSFPTPVIITTSGTVITTSSTVATTTTPTAVPTTSTIGVSQTTATVLPTTIVSSTATVLPTTIVSSTVTVLPTTIVSSAPAPGTTTTV